MTTTYLDSNLEHRTSISWDDGADGTLDQLYSYSYDSNTNLISIIVTEQGTVTRTSNYTYDSKGNRISLIRDEDGNGTTDNITTRTYDSQGNMLSDQEDENADGIADEITTWTYDSQGNMLSETQDEDADGLPEELYVWTYDSKGNVLSETENDEGNRKITLMTYDSSNNLLTSTEDYSADGDTDEIGTYTYDSNNNRLTYKVVQYDEDATSETHYRYDYNSSNKLTKTYYSATGDYEIAEMLIEENSYDSQGNLATVTHYSYNYAGEVTSRLAYAYDQYGNVLTSASYGDFDGEIGPLLDDLIVSSYTYSGGTGGSFVTVAPDIDGDGTPAGVDCDDHSTAFDLNVAEICDGLDNNCNGGADDGLDPYDYYPDSDGDSYGNETSSSVSACTPPAGYVTNNDDCDDANSAIKPGATEIADGIDNDCDHSVDENIQYTYYDDDDADGHGDPAQTTTSSSTSPPTGYVTTSDDCDDTQLTAYPGNTEICDTIDNDCDGLADDADGDIAANTDLAATGASNWYPDSDGDGKGNYKSVATVACNAPAGYVDNNSETSTSNSSNARR